MYHDVFNIKFAELNKSSDTSDDFSGVAEFIGDDFVLHAQLDDGCINGLIRILRYTILGFLFRDLKG